MYTNLIYQHDPSTFLSDNSIGLVIGLVFCSILMSCVASSVNATIVLFAEAPAEFEQNHPELSLQMREAWQKAYPGYDTQ